MQLYFATIEVSCTAWVILLQLLPAVSRTNFLLESGAWISILTHLVCIPFLKILQCNLLAWPAVITYTTQTLVQRRMFIGRMNKFAFKCIVWSPKLNSSGQRWHSWILLIRSLLHICTYVLSYSTIVSKSQMTHACTCACMQELASMHTCIIIISLSKQLKLLFATNV